MEWHGIPWWVWVFVIPEVAIFALAVIGSVIAAAVSAASAVGRGPGDPDSAGTGPSPLASVMPTPKHSAAADAGAGPVTAAKASQQLPLIPGSSAQSKANDESGERSPQSARAVAVAVSIVALIVGGAGGGALAWASTPDVGAERASAFEKGEQEGRDSAEAEGRRLAREALHEGDEQARTARIAGKREGLKQGRKKGIADGKREGLQEGESIGFDKGLEAGLTQGYTDGSLVGYDKGYAAALDPFSVGQWGLIQKTGSDTYRYYYVTRGGQCWGVTYGNSAVTVPC